MNGIKDLWQLNPDRREIVHVKKTAVIDFFSRDAPKRQPIRLRIKQLIQRVETARVARLSIDLGQRLFDCLSHLRRLRTPTFETSFDDFLFSNALRYSLRLRLGAFRQIFERGQNAL